MRAIAMILGFFLLSASYAAMATESADYPLRDEYAVVGVKTISTQNLAKNFDRYVVVDVRSVYEYQTLHIAGAHSIPLTDSSFSEQVAALAANAKKPLVFYCNGTTCAKSYKAVVKTLQQNMKQTLAYDAGIFAWAEAEPTRTVLLGEPMKSAQQLIPEAEFKAHSLSPRDFYEAVMGNNRAIVIDIRDAAQRAGISLFQMRDVHVPLDNDQLKVWIDRAKTENRPLYFVDATGHQVQWLQYFLAAQGVRSYWFMTGGAKAFESTM